MDLYQHIGEIIRDLRTARKLSQDALAKIVDETANTVSRWETGTYKPSAEHLEKLARYFEVSITVFFPGMEKQKEVPPALASATRGLKKDDLEEVIRYAEFRKARFRLKNPKRVTTLMTSDRDAYYAEIRKLARIKREEYSVRTESFGLKEINGIYRRETIKIDPWPLSSRLKAVYMCSNDYCSVAIRQKLPKAPKPFALVHELKHHWADRHLMEQGILSCGSYNENELIEKAAEVFAAEFIYPEREFSDDASIFMEGRKIQAFEIDDVVHFKRKFCKAKVSYMFIRKRLQWLNFALPERLDGAQFQKREDELYGPPIFRQPWFKERLKAKQSIPNILRKRYEDPLD